MNKKKYKVLVLGVDGMAGSMITAYLKGQGYNVHITTRNATKTDLHHQFDVVNDINTFESLVKEIQPEFVINCIGVLNQFAEDNKSDAVFINSYFPHYIDEISQKYNFKFVHISTDCVFSGERGKYCESDNPDATSFYGRTKMLGEVTGSKNLTFRTSIVGPDINQDGIGLFNWFMKQEGKIGGFDKVWWSGVTTLQLAKSIEKSFSMDISGLYHLVNNQVIDKYNLLLLFKKYIGKKIEIAKKADYINDKTLKNTRTDFEFDIPSYNIMIKEMIEWIDKHKEMYPYNN